LPSFPDIFTAEGAEKFLIGKDEGEGNFLSRS
jgi:hypothetical protein